MVAICIANGTVIKGEIDVAIKGKQWPLSCFGPFKERNNVPNFIEDLSFEEFRMMYLEAKAQNNIPAHQMQLAQMITEGKNKMQWLGTFNRGILNMLVELYNQQEPNASNKMAANPFASAPSVGNVSAAASIFGGGNATGTGGNAFGANANNSNSNNGGNIFGSTAPPQVQTNANLFGSNSAATGGNLFEKTATSGGNIFGMAAANLAPTQPTPATNMFGGPPVFSGGPVATGMFGSTIAQQPAQPTGASIFGATVTDGVSSGNIFAQAAFGQQSTPQAQLPFGGAAMGSPFAAVPANATGNSTITTTTSTGNSMFGNSGSTAFGASGNVAPPGSGLFSSAFGGGNFAQPTTTTTSQASIFVPTPQPQAIVPVASSAFGGNANHPFGGAQQRPPNAQTDAQLYSKQENLTKEQLDAFTAERFEMGKIPTVPPPKEFCH